MKAPILSIKTGSEKDIVQIKISRNHELIKLMNLLDFKKIIDILKKHYPKGKTGIQIDFGHHARVLILHLYTKHNYRDLVDQISSNVYFRTFMGFNIDDDPRDHSSYVKFHNLIETEGLDAVNFEILNIAMNDGHISDSFAEIDSTIKCANVTYPTDGKNLKTLLLLMISIVEHLKKNGCKQDADIILKNINVKLVLKLLKGHFFEKNKEKKMKLLEKSLRKVEYFFKVSWISILRLLGKLKKIKWYIERKVNKINTYAEKYLKQVAYYVRTGRAVANKILSFHQKDVVCITKVKDDKKYFFGRRFQIVRLENNFCFGIHNNDLKINDSTTFPFALELIFEELGFIPKLVGADCGYWSDENKDICEEAGVEIIGIQPKGKKEHLINDKVLREEVYNHRSGIEPIIGHLKNKGLGKSTMKTDKGTLREALGSFIAFNLKKLVSLVQN